MITELNNLMNYIENHITTKFSLRQAAQQIGISEYHLRRTFLFIAGISLTEYIRKRKLALANLDLLKGETVTSVAFKYGYHSVEGFSRAFHAWSNYLPSEIVNNRYQKSFPKLIFKIDVKGGVSVEFKIEEKKSFNLVGVTTRVPMQFEGENPAIQKLADSITSKQKEEMHNLSNLAPYQILNASYNFDDGRLSEKGELTELIGIATDQVNSYKDLSEINIEAHTWAIFPAKGPFPQTLQDTWAKIYSEWLPSADYELVEAPEISFTKKDPNSKDIYSEIWIAVAKKGKN